jgi:uracil-DNA glycosylase
MLWGSHAQGKRAMIDATRHLVLVSNHPRRCRRCAAAAFIGCGHFSQARAGCRHAESA